MKIRQLAAAFVVVGGLVAGAFTGIPAAGASEITCQIQNGCGTLHGIDAVGTPVALDAKKKADLGIDIAYPDLPGDRATAYSLVEHQGHGKWTFADKSETVSSQSGITGLNIFTGLNIPGALQFSYSSALVGTTTVSVTWPGSSTPTTVTLTGGAGSTPLPAYLRNGIYTVGISVTVQPPTVEGTPPPATTFTGTFGFTVQGNAVYVPAQPYYTIVYVTENGTWTSDCVTALPGGLLANEPCDWGRSPDQQFRFYTSNGGVLSTGSVVVPQSVSSQQYAVENAATGKYLESLSGLLPAQLLVPQSDAADALPFTGRQLDANGPSTAVWEFSS